MKRAEIVWQTMVWKSEKNKTDLIWFQSAGCERIDMIPGVVTDWWVMKAYVVCACLRLCVYAMAWRCEMKCIRLLCGCVYAWHTSQQTETVHEIEQKDRIHARITCENARGVRAPTSHSSGGAKPRARSILEMFYACSSAGLNVCEQLEQHYIYVIITWDIFQIIEIFQYFSLFWIFEKTQFWCFTWWVYVMLCVVVYGLCPQTGKQWASL